MLLLTSTGPEVFLVTMATILSYSSDNLEENINHFRSHNINSYPWENVAGLCAEILSVCRTSEIRIPSTPATSLTNLVIIMILYSLYGQF